MNKTDLIEKVAAKFSGKFSKTDVDQFLNATLDEITDELSKGGKVTLVGFGNFKVSDRKARSGRNPQTGAEIKIPAAKLPRFSAGKQLKDAVNNNKE